MIYPYSKFYSFITQILFTSYLWNKLLENSQIYLDNYEGWYSVRDEAFYAENELTKSKGK